MSFQEPTIPPIAGQPVRGSAVQRFGAGLTEDEVRRFQAILREECGVDVGLPEAWGRAIELLSLVEMLLQSQGILDGPAERPAEFALPRS
jgi:hypothetical protein